MPRGAGYDPVGMASFHLARLEDWPDEATPDLGGNRSDEALRMCGAARHSRGAAWPCAASFKFCYPAWPCVASVKFCYLVTDRGGETRLIPPSLVPHSGSSRGSNYTSHAETKALTCHARQLLLLLLCCTA